VDWANAFTTLGAATVGAAADDTYFLAKDHNEDLGTSTITFNTDSIGATMANVICVDHTGAFPPTAAEVTTGARFYSTTGAYQIGGSYYMYGVTLENLANSNIILTGPGNTYTSSVVYHDRVTYKLNGANGWLQPVTSSAQFMIMRNCQFNATQSRTFFFYRYFMYLKIIQDPDIPLSVGFPPTAFLFGSAGGGVTEIEGVDFSFMAAPLFQNTNGFGRTKLINCRLTSAIYGGNGYMSRTETIGCFNGAKNIEQVVENDTQLDRETTIVRTNGAIDTAGGGAVPFSWKIVTPATKIAYSKPTELFGGWLWNEAIGAPKTLDIHIVSDGLVLTNADVWLEVYYMDTAGSTKSALVTNRPANILDPGAALPASFEAWTTTGLANPNKQKLSVTFTPQAKGSIHWKLKVAGKGRTFYACPSAVLS
jgi:hypothetical protein